jgi:hypothetical protein
MRWRDFGSFAYASLPAGCAYPAVFWRGSTDRHYFRLIGPIYRGKA